MGIPQSLDEQVNGAVFDVWGGGLGAVQRTWGRRAALIFTCSLIAGQGASRLLLEQLLGVGGYSCAFRQEAYSILGLSFAAACGLLAQKVASLEPPVTDQSVALSQFSPCSERICARSGRPRSSALIRLQSGEAASRRR